jgi:hypothetical protein
MSPGKWPRLRIGAIVSVVLASVVLATPALGQSNAAFDRGYREGVERGQDDARRGREFQIERDRVYRDGDSGYNDRYGSRDAYRNDFRRGFSSGYREGYGNVRGGVWAQNRNGTWNGRDDRRNGRNRGYQEPALARGYSDGWERGLDDGRERHRYDPTREGDYRDADNGYSRSYGSKDAYKTNYRSGFRQGYEDGYRDATRGAWRR